MDAVVGKKQPGLFFHCLLVAKVGQQPEQILETSAPSLQQQYL